MDNMDPDEWRIRKEVQEKAANTPPDDPVLAAIWHLDRNLGKVWLKDIGLLQRSLFTLKWLAWLTVVLLGLILWRVW